MFSNETLPIVAAFSICKKEFNSTHKRNSQIIGNKAKGRTQDGGDLSFCLITDEISLNKFGSFSVTQ